MANLSLCVKIRTPSILLIASLPVHAPFFFVAGPGAARAAFSFAPSISSKVPAPADRDGVASGAEGADGEEARKATVTTQEKKRKEKENRARAPPVSFFLPGPPRRAPLLRLVRPPRTFPSPTALWTARPCRPTGQLARSPLVLLEAPPEPGITLSCWRDPLPSHNGPHSEILAGLPSRATTSRFTPPF